MESEILWVRLRKGLSLNVTTIEFFSQGRHGDLQIRPKCFRLNQMIRFVPD
jgi:hypothetical protein